MNSDLVLASFISNAKKIIGKKWPVAVLILAVSLIVIIFLIIRSSRVLPVFSVKSWEINLNFNSQTDNLTLKKIRVVSLPSILDERPAKFSPYAIEVFDKSGKMLYQTKIHITDQILYDEHNEKPLGALVLPTTLFIPYDQNAAKIIITKVRKNILEINLNGLKTLNLVPKAYADTQYFNKNCGPLEALFINDNYDNPQDFQAEVSRLENVYTTTPPYNQPNIFHFQEMDAPQHFDCDKTDLISCFLANADSIVSKGKTFSASAQKYIVLTNSNHAPPGVASGISDGPEGKIAIFTNYPLLVNGVNRRFTIAAHEFLGHDVGVLYDRYAFTDSFINTSVALQNGYLHLHVSENGTPVKSNCQEENTPSQLWREAGSTNAYPGCLNKDFYAPFPPSCVAPSNSNYVTLGSPDTMMSDLSCGSDHFDSVETHWIEKQIIPLYNTACPTSTPTFTSTPTQVVTNPITQAPTAQPTQALSGQVTVDIFIDTNGNGIHDASEQGFANALVTLSGPSSVSQTTDSTGIVKFNNLLFGNYTITVSILGQTRSQNFSLSQLVPRLTIIIPLSKATVITPSFNFSNPTSTPAVPTIPIIIQNPTPTTTQTFSTPTATIPTASPFPTDTSTDNTTSQDTPQVQYNCTPNQNDCGNGENSLQLCQVTFTCTPLYNNTSVTQIPTPITNSVSGCNPDNPSGNNCTCANFQTPSLLDVDQQQLIKLHEELCLGANSPNCEFVDACNACGANLNCIGRIQNHNIQVPCSTFMYRLKSDPNTPYCIGKPVIYLYPDKPTLVNVMINTPGTIYKSIPSYPSSGWKNILAQPGGTLLYHDKTYSELFYETSISSFKKPSDGIIIPAYNLESKLFEITARLGLLPPEQNEFVNYWLPKLTAFHSNYILFSLIDNKEKDRIDHVEVIPKPDARIEFLAYFAPLAFPKNIKPLQFPQPSKRTGFTEVEWGGLMENKVTK